MGTETAKGFWSKARGKLQEQKKFRFCFHANLQEELFLLVTDSKDKAK